MKTVCALIVFAMVALLVAAGENKYATKYDGLDIDKILSNNRILSSYIKCIMDEGPCTAEGRELKKLLPDALATGCEKCSDKQKTSSSKVIRHLMNKRPEDWRRLTTKFDPKGEFQKNYAHLVKTE